MRIILALLTLKCFSMPESHRSYLKDQTKEAFQHGKLDFYLAFNGYMRFAFPMDELNPLKCIGIERDPDENNR
jgi:hypothetical protein